MAEAKAGKLATSKDDFARLPFSNAAERFLSDRIPYLAPRSIQTERERVKPLNKSLGDVAVWRMTPAQVVGYIRERKLAGRSKEHLPDGHHPWRPETGSKLHYQRIFTRYLFARTSGGRSPTKRRSSYCTGRGLAPSGKPSRVPHGSH